MFYWEELRINAKLKYFHPDWYRHTHSQSPMPFSTLRTLNNNYFMKVVHCKYL